jgi:hypothetical protein
MFYLLQINTYYNDSFQLKVNLNLKFFEVHYHRFM